jgi:hypothetical protein
MPAIIKQYGSNNDFTRIALASPIAALEKTGLKFTDAAKEEIEAHVRFGKEGAKRFTELKENIFSAAGSRIDLKNNAQIAETILYLAGEKDTRKSASAKQAGEPLHYVIDRAKLTTAINTPPKKTADGWQDSLAEFRAVNPLIPLLLEYRQMDAGNSAFADAKDIPAIEKKLKNTPLSNVVFSLKRNSSDNPK